MFLIGIETRRDVQIGFVLGILIRPGYICLLIIIIMSFSLVVTNRPFIS